MNKRNGEARPEVTAAGMEPESDGGKDTAHDRYIRPISGLPQCAPIGGSVRTRKRRPSRRGPAPNVARIPAQPGERTQADMLARVAVTPQMGAGVLVHLFRRPGLGELAIGPVLNHLNESVKKVSQGDLSNAEALLIAQAHSLDAIYNELARRAGLNMGENLPATEAYLKLALRAQGQCRATVETLGQLKNPAPVAFVRQANIANGPQQVNNGVARADETDNLQSKLLEGNDGQRMDAGAQEPAGRAYRSLEAVGTIDRPTHGGGKGARGAECVQRGEARPATGNLTPPEDTA